MSQQNSYLARTQKIILSLNKSGLSYLTHKQFIQAYQYFKHAQKIIDSQLIVDSQNLLINKLAGITYNNLACYYKKTNKSKISLIYLQKALQIQVNVVQDWVATAATHLNICAIYSFRKQHQSAANHAQLALKMLAKLNTDHQDSDHNTNRSKNAKSLTEQQQKWINNLHILAYYNLAVEQEHLKKYGQAIEAFDKARNLGKLMGSKHAGLITVCDLSIDRLREALHKLKNRLISAISKRQQDKEKGFHDYMRLNKKNIPIKNRIKSVNGIHINDKLKQLKNYKQKKSLKIQNGNHLHTCNKNNQQQKNQIVIKSRNSYYSNVSLI